MRILLEDLKHGMLKVSIENLDDLWILYNLIRRGDTVHSKTTREVKVERVGGTSSRRVPANLGLKVEKVYFDKDLARLRIHGVVVDAPEDLNILGSHHTISLSEGGIVTIIKEFWAQHEVEGVRKAIRPGIPVIIVALDNDECAVGVSRSSGVDVSVELKSMVPSKREADKREQAMLKYLAKVSEALVKVCERVNGKIVIVGPAFTKDHLARYLRDKFPDLADDVAAVKSVSSGGAAGIFEAIRVGVVGKVLRDARMMEESEMVEELLARLGASTGDVSYGMDEVEGDAASGAVQTILICDEKLRGAEGEERMRLEGILKTVESKGGRVVVVSTGHEGGRKLNSLGGIAAFLRYSRHRSF
ncbi:MAG: mRNA surveillance protein pelota [Candidatus Bathyarchaeia archaeon]